MRSCMLALLGGALGWSVAAAAEPSYPHVNVAIEYEIDAKWPQKPAEFKWIEFHGVAVDNKDQVYAFTRGTPPVQVYDANGKFLRAWGQGYFKEAHSIKTDPEGNVWVSDIGHQVVRKYTPEGKLLMTLGTLDQAGRDKTHFNLPTDMIVTKEGHIFVTDGYGNARVVHFDPQGKYVNEWGELSVKPGQFSVPHSICVDSKGKLYVADRNNVRVQVFDQSGKLLDVWNDLLVPMSLCVNKDDKIWAVGSSPQHWRAKEVWLGSPPYDQLFMKFNGDGKALQLWAVTRGVDGRELPGVGFKYHQMAVDSKGNLYAADLPGKRVQKFVPKIPAVRQAEKTTPTRTQ
jgi:streptogramin lyase